MDEWKPLYERRVSVPKSSNSIMQRSRSPTVIWRCAVPEELLVHVLCHKRRKSIADRPHRTNHSPVTHKQHSCSDMDGLIGQILVTRCRLTRREKGEPTAGTRNRDNVREFQAALIGETEATINGTRGILDSMACKMDPLCILHQGKYFLDRSNRRLHKGGSG